MKKWFINSTYIVLYINCYSPRMFKIKQHNWIVKSGIIWCVGVLSHSVKVAYQDHLAVQLHLLKITEMAWTQKKKNIDTKNVKSWQLIYSMSSKYITDKKSLQYCTSVGDQGLAFV